MDEVGGMFRIDFNDGDGEVVGRGCDHPHCLPYPMTGEVWDMHGLSP